MPLSKREDAALADPGYIVIRKDLVVLDAEAVGGGNKLGERNNNGRKILARDVWQGKEERISQPLWHAPCVFPTGGVRPAEDPLDDAVINVRKPDGVEAEVPLSGNLQVATFTEFSGQDRHMHRRGIETYTVLRGRMEILLNDEGPLLLNEGDEVIVFPWTIHEVIQQRTDARQPYRDFELLVRVHTINCPGDEDKFVQLKAGGEWVCWKDLTREQKAAAYKRQRQGS